jgi:hypothetical protein
MTASPKTRSTFCAICVSNDVVRVRARATIGSLEFSRAPASHYQSAAITPSMVGGRWGRTVERGGPSQALRFVPVFSSDAGQRRLIRIWAGTKSTASKCFSSLRALVHDANQTASRVFHRFLFSPVLLWSVAHERNHRRRIGQSAVKG